VAWQQEAVSALNRKLSGALAKRWGGGPKFAYTP